MESLWVYGLCTNLQWLLYRYWEEHRVVPHSKKYYVHPFKTGRGVTQGDPFFSAVFNIVVYVVMWETLREICGPQETLYGLGWDMGYQDMVLYTDNGRVMVINPI